MPQFPVVDDQGCLDKEQVVLTKSLLGFYVNKRSLAQVTAYADGLRDTCDVIEEAIKTSKEKNLTVEQFREHLQGVITERHSLMTTIHDYINQARAENRITRTPD